MAAELTALIWKAVVVLVLVRFAMKVREYRVLNSWHRAGFPWVRYSWRDVRRLLCNDPLSIRFSPPYPGMLLKDAATAVIVVCALFLSAALIKNWLLSPAISETGVNNVDRPLAALIVAAIGGIVALAGVLLQVRSKVRSENRQKWIEDVRNTLADVLNHVPRSRASLYKLTETGDANRSRLKLEVLLNPSEKDHRTLSTLFRMAYGIEPIELDKPVFKMLPFLSNMNPWESSSDRTLLITYIVRLSNALLKREWEVVKSAQ